MIFFGMIWRSMILFGKVLGKQGYSLGAYRVLNLKLLRGTRTGP